jgi:hypothetical protein
MRRTVLGAVLILAVGVPALAAPAFAQYYNTSGLPYDLRITGTQYPGVLPGGRIDGMLGGLPVRGSYENGNWTLFAFDRPFALGTYRCFDVCVFRGDTLADMPFDVSFTSPVPVYNRSLIRVSGTLPMDGFVTREQWVGIVARWADRNDLQFVERSEAINDASGI